jgi:uncharacterized membrane protein YgaE (UPF0421/DUF939 family)
MWNVIAACALAFLIGLVCYLLILLSYWHPWVLVGLVIAAGVGTGWAAVAYRERN